MFSHGKKYPLSTSLHRYVELLVISDEYRLIISYGLRNTCVGQLWDEVAFKYWRLGDITLHMLQMGRICHGIKSASNSSICQKTEVTNVSMPITQFFLQE